MRSIELTADLRITSEEYDISIQSSEKIVYIKFNAPTVPAIPWYWLKYLFRNRKTATKLLSQEFECQYNNTKVYAQRKGKIAYLNWMFAARIVWASLVR